jgi:dTDP-4-amino-4,6-dideoxygalactose transaminase
MIDIRVPFVDLRPQNEVLKQEVFDRFSRVIERSAFTLGDEVLNFEEQFALFCRVQHAVGVASGTDALVLALRAIGIGPGDEVITAVNTFVATVEAIVHTGATPVLVDIDSTTYGIDIPQVERIITSKTKAIIPVHLYGYPADMDPILDLAKRHHLFVVEDAAQAHGAEYWGRRVGSLGDVACFSFYPSKNLGAFGDAGAVVTNREDVASSVRALRDHGSIQRYEHRLVGYTSRLHTLQAAVLGVKLPYLDQWNIMRQSNAQLYNELLSDLPGVVLPVVEEGRTHVFHLFVIRLESADRDALGDYLVNRGISTGIHYPSPVHMTGAFQYLGYRPGDFPVAELCSQQILSLPMYPELEPEKIAYVAGELTTFLRGK